MKVKISAVLFLLLLLAVATVAPAYALSSKDVEGELMCQCGCTMVVDVCDCEQANQIRDKIAELMGQGQNKEQIIAYFVGRYGEKMLSAPTKKGFNLFAWVVPFAAVVLGGTGLFFLLRAWARRGKREEASEEIHTLQPVSIEEYRGRLEEELKKFKEEGTR
ncbi:MAG: cytochrome c-type biogenesis protein CcmH [Chloroflexi bacterium]|nr:cytochrome c-type biogenesis protein CcmH [Chloroflexota bacterium]